MASLVNHFSFPPTVLVFLLYQFVLVNALPACLVVSNFASLEDCIRSYWFIGYKYTSIITFLSLYHGIHITVRQLKYLINIKYNLWWRNNESAAHEIRRTVHYELNGPGCLMGYRSMTRCLRTRYNLNVSRNTVMRLLKELDPVSVEQRRARWLRRRVYRCPGPNVIWHIDGYDKRAPFGFGISGCIDGYSRRIMYLRVSSTNHDPSLISGYYMACVEQLSGCPRKV